MGEPFVQEHPYGFGMSIPQFDCDAADRLRLSAVLRYVERAAVGHLDSLGLTHQKLFDEGIIFVLAAVALKIWRIPKAGESVRIKTCPAVRKGAQMIRETLIVSPEGERCIECQAAWVIVDPRSRKLLRPCAFQYTLPRLSRWEPFEDPSRMRLPLAQTPAGQWPVRYSQLDLNGHLNNTVYADILMDTLPIEVALGNIPCELRVRYKKELRHGDVLDLRLDGAQSAWNLSGYHGQDLCFEASIIFT
jgi:acyl-ACP thioesterase